VGKFGSVSSQLKQWKSKRPQLNDAAAKGRGTGDHMSNGKGSGGGGGGGVDGA